MIVSKIMTKNPFFVSPELSLTSARSLMDKEKIGHLPVLNKDKKLVGLVTKVDLLKAAPSSATTLDMYEISYLLAKLNVEKVMTKDVVTVQENEVIEEAARIMADRRIGCLPVMKGTELIGIVTDTDIFHFFINAFGARHQGVRVSINFKEKRGQIAAFAGKIFEKGGNIAAFVTAEGDDDDHRRGTLKVSDISRADVESIVQSFGDAVIEDIRD
ncbi:MAG: CBS domain-containing protein [Treponema sp.]|nr:CBS domain-containing protein [Treponema sp.]